MPRGLVRYGYGRIWAVAPWLACGAMSAEEFHPEQRRRCLELAQRPAAMMLIGEQPRDQKDALGQPFVCPWEGSSTTL